MPTYEWRCNNCGREWSEQLTIEAYSTIPAPECPQCDISMSRVFSFVHKTGMPEHFNNTTGQVVSSSKQFADQLKRQSEEATIRTGIEHNFVPVDAADKKAFGVTNEGLAATYDRRKKLGMPIPDAIKPANMD